MKTTLFTKNGPVSFSPEDPEPSIYRESSPMWKAVTAAFNHWLLNFASEEEYEMYNGSFEELYGGSYLSWRGAVEMGIDAVCEYALENHRERMTTKEFNKIDLEGIFQS